MQNTQTPKPPRYKLGHVPVNTKLQVERTKRKYGWHKIQVGR